MNRFIEVARIILLPTPLEGLALFLTFITIPIYGADLFYLMLFVKALRTIIMCLFVMYFEIIFKDKLK